MAAESKSKAKSPKAKQAPVKAGGMGAKILAAMNQKNKIQLKSSQEKGDFEIEHLAATNIDMQAPGLLLLNSAYEIISISN